MCLDSLLPKNKRVKYEHDEDGVIVGYKVLVYHLHTFHPVFYGKGEIPQKTWINAIDYRQKTFTVLKPERHISAVQNVRYKSGWHFFPNIISAERYRQQCQPDSTVVICRVKVKTIVARGYSYPKLLTCIARELYIDKRI